MGDTSCRTVSFKLKNQINFDELSDRENFSFDRTYREGEEVKLYFSYVHSLIYSYVI